MKIREIMKRTMAIGLATAMLLQSQSVVTLAETMQADTAETVVVDVGEETSVSGNGEEKKEEAEAEAEDINSDDPTIETETDEEEEASEESLIDENELEANMQFCESVESEIVADQAIDTTGFKDTYGLSYEELFTACPSYLDNMTAETIFNMMSDNAGEAWTEGLAQKDMAKAVYMMTQGSSYAINELLAEAGLTQSDYSKFQEEMAKRVIRNYLQTKPEEETYYNAMSTALSKISGTYSNAKDYTTLAGVIVEGTSDRLVQRDIEDILKKLDSNSEIMKYVKGFDQYCKMEATLVMLYSYDMGAVDTLIAAQKKVNPNNNDLLTGLQLVRTQMNDPYQYIMDKYVNDKVLSIISKELNTWLTEGVLGMTSMEAAVLNIIIQTAGLVYGIFNPTYEEIQYASIAFYYYSDATKSVKNYQKKLRNKNYKTSIPQDQILYEAAYSLRITCMQTFLDASKKCTSNKTLKKCLQTYSNMCSKGSMNYENYIKLCMNAASEDIKAGRLTITSTGVTKKTSDGTVIDASYDSKPSITAKLTAIMEKYPENYTWSSSWGGCSQCFGFARMVFSKLFGCEMPASYKGAKRYEYSNENNVNLVGQLEGSAVTASAVKDLFASARVGDIIQGCGSTWGQHTMVLIGVTDTGIQVYDCNSNNDNKVHTKSITWDRLATRYGSSATYANGISIYEADNYSEIYGDGDSVFFDDTANFTINDEGCITKYTGSQRIVIIPDTINDITVTEIGESVFKNNTRMVMVHIPESVTKIGNCAFDGCSNLMGTNLPESLICMGSSAFRNCNSLTSIEIPKTLEKLDTYINYVYYHGPFQGCTNLREIQYEEGITSIPEYIFLNCEGISNIVIPDTVTDISVSAFEGCINLEQVKFSKNLTSIGASAFAGCKRLVNLDIPDSVSDIGNCAFDGCSNITSVHLPNQLYCMGSSAFRNCEALTQIIIPKKMKKLHTYVNYTYYHGPFQGCKELNLVKFEDGITSIPEYLFLDCEGIKTIEIPDTVTSISVSSFEGCTKLENVIFNDNLVEIGASAFAGCDSLIKVNIPDSVTIIGNKAFQNCTSLKEVELSKKLYSIGSSAFMNCAALTFIEIPKTLKKMGTYVWYTYYHGPFQGCESLSKAKIDDGTKNVLQYLFMDCNGLEEIEFPDSVECIEQYAFENCTHLQKVTFSNNLKTIDKNAFSNCTSLENVVIPMGCKTLGDSVLQNCVSLREAYIGDSVDSIGTAIFSGCTKLERVHIPNIRQNIVDSMFYNCISLKEINLPETLIAIRSSAFYNCDSLSEMALPKNVQIIESNAFYDCDGITKLVIPDSVTSIGNNAFNSCELLSDVSLGTGLTAISEGCFANCPSLKEIVLPYRIQTINAKAFNACTALTDVTIPRSVTTIGSQVFSYPAKMTIYGISGTYAETYANDNGIKFVNKEIKASRVSLNKEEVTLSEGTSTRLLLSVMPSNFTDQVTWKTADAEVATIEEDGTLHANAIGFTTIKVIVGNAEAICKVTVVQPVTSISILGNYEILMESGDEKKLTATVYPQNAFNKEIRWESSDESVVSASQTGEIKALKKGSARITVTALDGSECSDYVDVTVTNNCIYAKSVEEMQSPHPYEVDSSDKWVYTLNGASKTYVTFDARTEVEDGFDYIYLYDKNKSQVGKYTGKELAGKTVSVDGDTVIVQLISDDAGIAYGFSVSQISDKESGEAPQPTPAPNPTPTEPASTSVYTYEVLSDGTIRITSCQTSDVNLVIPDTIDGYTVTEIGANAFANQTSIQTVKFPANLKQIGVKAFANCTGLLEVSLPDTIQGAGQLCFSGCTALKKAVLNKGRINIVYGMFENCTSLTEVVIPDTVENIAMYAFLNCRSLTHLNLPASLKSISVHAFEGAGVTTITYAGTKAQWQKVKKNLTGNGSFVTATVTDSTGVSFAVSGSNNGNQNPQQTVKKPGKVKITKAKNVKTKKLTVKWKKTSKAKGYQIQIATNKKFTKGKKTKTLSKTTYSFKKLKKNKYYYVRIRAYVYDSNHKKVYGSWSAVKKVKIKK